MVQNTHEWLSVSDRRSQRCNDNNKKQHLSSLSRKWHHSLNRILIISNRVTYSGRDYRLDCRCRRAAAQYTYSKNLTMIGAARLNLRTKWGSIHVSLPIYRANACHIAAQQLLDLCNYFAFYPGDSINWLAHRTHVCDTLDPVNLLFSINRTSYGQVSEKTTMQTF